MSDHICVLDKQALIVRAINDEATNIRSYELAFADGAALPPAEAGAHVAIHLPNGLTRQYSLYDQPGAKTVYRIAVLKDPKSRGGSEFMHEQVKVGDQLNISGPFNNFPLSAKHQSATLIAGGIGLTPVISMARHLHQCGTPFSLHYCARNEVDAAFVEELRREEAFSGAVQMYFDGGDPAKGLNVRDLLAEIVGERHLYCCGPGGLMDAVEAATKHWPKGTVHFERFKAEPVNSAENTKFTIHLSRSNVEFEVPADKSILNVLREQGFDIDTVCEEGVCGSCLTDVLEGIPEHRDQILNDDEKSKNDVMAVCCSRAKTSRLVLDI